MKKNTSKIPLARNALKRSKTIRFPDCLKFVDGIETETQIIIGTEQVEPLHNILFHDLDLKLVCLGIFKLSTTLKFLAEDCRMVHGFVSTSSLFVTRSGEWKLGGFESLTGLQDDQSMIKLYGHLLPSTRFVAPELGGSSTVPSAAIDAWSLGCLIWTIFNGSLNNPNQLETRGKIPSNLFRYSKSLCVANPGARLDFQKFLKLTSATKGYFDDPFISCCMFLEQFALKDKAEKEDFLLNVEHTVGTFPIEFCKFKILPELLHSLEFGGAGSRALKPILTIGGRFEKEDFNELVTPSIIKLFNSNDRSIRLALCEKIESYVENLTPNACNDTIFPNLASGFLDTTPIIREQTLKAVIVLAPKLSSKTINNALLRHLAKLQLDSEPGIRTNTTICLAKLSKYFDESVRYF
jgi:SCY1-like protein 1